MQQYVYADLLFLINFSMDYLCLYITARIMHRKMILSRMLAASALGGVYSVVSIFFTFGMFPALAVDALICLLICAIVFTKNGIGRSNTLLCSFLFLGISMMMGGAMTAIFNLLNRLDLPLEGIVSDGISTYIFAIVAAVAGFISLKSGQIASHRSTVSECRVIIRFGDKTATLNALIDSGNLIREPISGKAVIVVDREALAKAVDIAVFDRFTRGDQTKNNLRSLRLIPIKTASGSGMLAAAMPDEVTLSFTDGKGKERCITADAMIAPSSLDSGADGYSAILPAELIKS